MKKCLLLIALTISSYTLAQENIQYQETIDVSGAYTEKELSPAEKLKKMRADLEKQNELMVRKKIETMRLQSEVEMMKKLQKVFNQQMQALENIN